MAASAAPWPLVEIAVAPMSEADREKLGPTLARLAAEDPGLQVSLDRESGLTILGGADEHHLGGAIDRLRRVHAVDVDVGAPQVAYRETLGQAAEIDFTHRRLVGLEGEFARVVILFEPGQPGTGYRFASRVEGWAVPGEYQPGVERGLEAAAQDGLLAGFPVIDFAATLVDGAWHDLDSSAASFEIAARGAFRKLRDAAQPKLLEPVMRLEVTTPIQRAWPVLADLSRRRAEILDSTQQDRETVIIATVPLANLFGYADDLSAITEGRAAFHMAYDRYAPVPQRPPPDDRFPPAIGMRA